MVNQKIFWVAILVVCASLIVLSEHIPSDTESPFAQEVPVTDILSKDSAEVVESHYSPDTVPTHTIKDKIDPYQVALTEISQMLNGNKPLSFKRAVFLTENAYYGGTLNWIDFCAEINKIKNVVNGMIVSRGLQHYKTAGNWAVFTYMTDSIPENNYTPYQYDLENFMGENDYESFMVSSLLKTKKGNCHSLPYLYKILADEVNVEAFIALAPMHCFIKHKDEKGQWWNLELTSGTFSRTSFIIESFNVSDAGIASGLYLKPLDERESIAQCLDDLLAYRDKKTGIYYGKFVKQVYEVGLAIKPNSLLQLVKYDNEKYSLDNAMEKLGINDYQKISQYPELVAMEQQLKSTQKFIVEMGYSQISAEEYKKKVMEVRTMSTTPETTQK